ncbi:TPA: hypothetical protein TVL37_000677 [Streptococcus equi subsp. zooepidemicus]|nr:hypothetical protein [Streptococcus equi subsp. zooepidemicus]
MELISIKKFAALTAKHNKDIDQKEFEKSLQVVLHDKQNGVECVNCGAPIWAAGSATTGSYMCFTCITGEVDDSDDFEFF